MIEKGQIIENGLLNIRVTQVCVWSIKSGYKNLNAHYYSPRVFLEDGCNVQINEESLSSVNSVSYFA